MSSIPYLGESTDIVLGQEFLTWLWFRSDNALEMKVPAMKILVGITGASGGIYAVRLLEELSKGDFELHAVFSRTGEQVVRFECGAGKERFPDIRWHESDNMFSEIASGSAMIDRMAVVPCSKDTSFGVEQNTTAQTSVCISITPPNNGRR